MVRQRGIRVKLRLLLWSCAAIFAGLTIALWWVTRPEFLRAALQPQLDRLPWPVTVAHVNLSWTHGLQLIDVSIAVPLPGTPDAGDAAPGEKTGPGSSTNPNSSAGPESAAGSNQTAERLADVRPAPGSPALDSILHVARLQIECRLLDLLWGEVRPKLVRFSGVHARLVVRPWSADDGFTLSDRDRLGFWRPSVVRAFAARSFPPLRVDDADVEIFLDDGPRPRLAHRLRLHGRGQPEPDGYTLLLDGLTTSGARLAELRWHRPSGELTAATDWIDLDLLTPWLPEELRRELAALDLRGRVQLERGSYCLDPTPLQLGQPGEFALRFEQLRAARPLTAERDNPARPPYLRWTDGAGRLLYEAATPATGPRFSLTATGRLHDAATTLRVSAGLSALTALLDGRLPHSAELHYAELMSTRLHIPTEQEQPEFITADELPRAIRQFLADYRPRGPLNIHLRIAPGASVTGPPHVLIDFDAVDCGLRYHKFPYDFENVRGRVRMVNEQIFVEGLHGRHGSARARVDGYVSNTEAWAELDLAIRAEHVALDAALYRALSPNYRRLWHSAAPLGLCDAWVRIQRPEGSPLNPPEEATTDVDLRLLRGSISLDEGLRLENASGFITVRDEGVSFHDLHGYVGAAEARVTGLFRTDGTPPSLAMEVDLDRWPVSREAVVAGGRLAFNGVANVWGRVVRATDDENLEQFFSARIIDGELRGFDPQQAWEACRGWVTISDAAQRVRALRATRGTAWLEAAGELPGDAPPDDAAPPPVTADAAFTLSALPSGLALRAGGPELAQILRQLLPPDWAARAAELNLAGAGEFSAHAVPACHLGPDPTAQSAEAGTRVRLEAERARPQLLPLDLQAIRAEACIRADGFDSLRVQAGLSGGGQLEATGGARWSDGVESLDLRISARDLTFSPALLEALPGALGRTLTALTPTGDFDAQLERVAMRRTPAGPEWEILGVVQLRAASLDVGLPLDELHGEVRGAGRVTAAGDTHLDCALRVTRGRLAGRPIEQLEGRLFRSGTAAVELRELRGRYCDGQAIADVRVDPSSAQYELMLTFQDVSMDAFFALADGPARRSAEPQPGRLDGTIFLRGRGGETAGRRGGGSLRIHGATIMQTPVLPLLIEQQKDPATSPGGAVDTVELRFTLSGSQLELQRVELFSRDLRLVGEGRWNLADDSVRLILVGAHPHKWPRVAVLSDLVERAGQELMQYRVEGTLTRPRVTVEPLRAVTAPLRKLLLGE